MFPHSFGIEYERDRIVNRTRVGLHCGTITLKIRWISPHNHLHRPQHLISQAFFAQIHPITSSVQETPRNIGISNGDGYIEATRCVNHKHHHLDVFCRNICLSGSANNMRPTIELSALPSASFIILSETYLSANVVRRFTSRRVHAAVIRFKDGRPDLIPAVPFWQKSGASLYAPQ